MAESIRARANRYAKGDFTKRELLTIIGGFVADQVVDVATYGQLSKLKGKALTKIVFPAGKASGSIIARGAIGAAKVAGRSLAGAAAPILASPVAVGTGLGLGALATPQGQALLEAAEERGRMDRIRLEQYLTDVNQRLGEFRADPIGELRSDAAERGGLVRPIGVPFFPKRKKSISKFNKAVSRGMKVVKASTSYGKKGTINNAKKAFTVVTKTTSKINKGAKVAKSGITRKIGLAVKRIL